MTFYSDLALVASSLLSQFGQKVTLRQFAADVYNPATSTNTPGASTDYSVNAAVFSFGTDETQFMGTIIHKEDRKMLMEHAAGGPTPTLKDRVIDSSGVTFTIISIKDTAPSGLPLIHTLHLRR